MFEIVATIVLLVILYRNRKQISFLFRRFIYKHIRISLTREEKTKDHRLLSDKFVIHNDITREEYYSCILFNGATVDNNNQDLLEYIGSGTIIPQHIISKILKLWPSDDFVLSPFKCYFSNIKFYVVLYTIDKEKRPVPIIVADTSSNIIEQIERTFDL